MAELRTGSKLMDEHAKKFQEEQRKSEIDYKRKEMDNTLEQNYKKYLDAKEKYGEDHFKTMFFWQNCYLLSHVHDVADMMFDLQEVFMDIDKTMGFIDESMQMINDLMTVNPDQKYTIFTAGQNRRRVKKFCRNMKNRMRAMFATVSVTKDIMNTMIGFTSKMSKGMGTYKKSRKKGAQQDTVMADLERKYGGSATQDTTEKGNKPADAPGKGKGASSKPADIDVDDII